MGTAVSCLFQWWTQDFLEEGAPTPQGGCQHMNLSIFPKNCKKLKEFGPPGGHTSPAPPLDLPLSSILLLSCQDKELYLKGRV